MSEAQSRGGTVADCDHAKLEPHSRLIAWTKDADQILGKIDSAKTT